jgi:hypothetical protein
MRVMRASVVSSAALLLSTSSAPSPLIVPANTSPPGSLLTGTLSPVIGAWLTALLPEITRPSSAIRSPGRTMKRVPTGASAAAISRSSPPGERTRTVDGARSSSAEIARRARPTLQASRVSDSANRKATLAASNHSPMPMAPAIAITIKRLMSGRSRRAAYHALTST